MERFARFAMLGVVLASGWSSSAEAQSSGAKAFIVVDQHSGHVLASGNSAAKLQVASLTKIATAMVVLDWAEVHKKDLAEIANVPQSALTVGGANPIGLAPGDQASLRDLVYASLLQSDNVAAHTLANHVGGRLKELAPPSSAVHQVTNVDYFVRQMNALAKKLSMTKSLFLNPTGIDSVEKPYSTAADMARLASYAMADAGFRFYVSQKERKIVIIRMAQPLGYMLKNTNELLGVDAIDGVKTGQTAKAGPCLIVSAAREPEIAHTGDTVQATPRRLVLVVLGSGDRFNFSRNLLAQGWQLYDAWAAKGRPVSKR